MVVFHRSYCSACDRLGSEGKENEELIELSKQFVMISCNQDGPCEDDAFAIGGDARRELHIDGRYFPRVFFINADNTINYRFVSNPNNFQYRYFYRSSEQLLQRMKDFLRQASDPNEDTDL